MNIDHIFIFTHDNGKAADELVDFGIFEGTNRVHIGQGTTNRKFYFENFFLEILWVQNEQKIKSNLIRPTGLWDRADFLNNNYSPFGLCIVNEKQTNKVFENCYKYQPEYFPNGMSIDIIKNDNQPSLPWTFRLPFKGQNKNESESKNHRIGVNYLTKAIFEYSGLVTNKFLDNFNNEEQINFKKTERNWLTLSFDNALSGKTKDFKEIKLTIEY